MEWQLAEAKDRLGELLTRATTEGPQTIRRNGTAVIVVAEDAFLALVKGGPTFKDWLLNGPRIDDLPLPSRANSVMREADI